ncbi:MAG TPA: protein phosphatase 2C domain-containing protein [Mycobacteriales bacterium]|nr:protein phosphatase 2C domain-containing protein [Mycobacteriales bacterium]
MSDLDWVDLSPSRVAIGDPGRAGLEITTGPCPPRSDMPDIELSAAENGGVVALGGSVRGLLHRRNGEVRQDAFAYQVSGDGRWIAVVCDGVGSYGRSDEASNLVARRVAELHSGGSSLTEALTVANEELRVLAEFGTPDPDIEDRDAGRMATTVVAISVALQDGLWLGEMCWVGDSAAWHLSPEGEWSMLNDTGSGADAALHSTATSALPHADPVFKAVPLCIDGGALFVMTDGFSNPMAWSEDVQREVAARWSTPPDLFTFGAQVGFPRRGHMDDRTVVGLWPAADAAAVPV